jgi:hypothetical protein
VAKNENVITVEAHSQAVADAFERGVTICHAAILARINDRVLVCRGGANNEMADRLIALKGELPSVEKIIASARG